MAIENLIPELSWLCALLFLFIGVLLIASCVCFKDNEKPQEYGTAGRLSITRDSPILHFHQPRNGGTLSISSRHGDHSSDDDNPKSCRNSWTVKDRALPEIPDSDHHLVLENGIHPGNVGNEHVKLKGRNRAMAPKPPGNDPSKVFPVNGNALLTSDGTSGVTVTIAINDKTQIIGTNSKNLEIGAKPRLAATDSVPSTSSNMVVLKKMEKKDNADDFSSEDSCAVVNLYDTVAENSNERFLPSGLLSSHPVENPSLRSSVSNEESPSVEPSASLAVAGGVPSSDIPYMTPPLLPTNSFEMPEESNETGSRGEVPYTVISVREPLARVREITMRKQRATVQQNSEDSEDHYAMVPEEEQMYAEIGSGHDSGSSSITYAHIEPRELPPVPPTVESLKSVAHAHSRQASTVSTCSFTSNVSSTGEPTSPTVLGNPSTSLYSTVDKQSNKQRKTIHLAEGISIVTATSEKRKKVEDMYAKVRKKRVDLTISASGAEDYTTYQGVHGDNMECITPPPSPWASTTPPAPPPIAGRLQAATLSVLLPGGSHHTRRHSADPNLPEVINDNRVFSGSNRSSLVLSNTSEEPNYERIYNEENNSGDSCYEKIKDDSLSNGHSSKVVFTHQVGEPGYERVKDKYEDTGDPGYECVAQTSHASDPGYEPVRAMGSFDDSDSNSDYTIVKIDEIKEPGYEVVKKVPRSRSDAADPGYEKIKKVPRADSDATDPGYERVKDTDEADPGYETVNRSDSDTDPCYEIVRQGNVSSLQCGPRNTVVNYPPTVTQTSKSTILFVSGNSQSDMSCSASHNTHVFKYDPNVTFL